MSQTMEIKIHEIAKDGLPPEDGLEGRVAFIFDGCIISGWPVDLLDAAGRPLWESNSDVGHSDQFAGVTHWIEFPTALWNIE